MTGAACDLALLDLMLHDHRGFGLPPGQAMRRPASLLARLYSATGRHVPTARPSEFTVAQPLSQIVARTRAGSRRFQFRHLAANVIGPLRGLKAFGKAPCLLAGPPWRSADRTNELAANPVRWVVIVIPLTIMVGVNHMIFDQFAEAARNTAHGAGFGVAADLMSQQAWAGRGRN